MPQIDFHDLQSALLSATREQHKILQAFSSNSSLLRFYPNLLTTLFIPFFVHVSHIELTYTTNYVGQFINIQMTQYEYQCRYIDFKIGLNASIISNLDMSVCPRSPPHTKSFVGVPINTKYSQIQTPYTRMCIQYQLPEICS